MEGEGEEAVMSLKEEGAAEAAVDTPNESLLLRPASPTRMLSA